VFEAKTDFASERSIDPDCSFGMEIDHEVESHRNNELCEDSENRGKPRDVGTLSICEDYSGQWVVRKETQERLLWLPREHTQRVSSWDAVGDSLALGHESGEITVLRSEPYAHTDARRSLQ
jgi:hypothetical protein